MHDIVNPKKNKTGLINKKLSPRSVFSVKEMAVD